MMDSRPADHSRWRNVMAHVPGDPGVVATPADPHVVRAKSLLATRDRPVPSKAYWIRIVAACLLGLGIIIVCLVMFAMRHDEVPWSINNPNSDGSMALAQVLEDQGVTVDQAESFAEVQSLSVNPDSTIVLANANLASVQFLEQLAALDRPLVLVQPKTTDLQYFTAGLAATATTTNGTLSAGDGCQSPTAPAFFRALGSSATLGEQWSLYSATGNGPADTVGCLTHSGDGSSALLYVPQDRLLIVGSSQAFTNEYIDDHANAAIALGAAGQTSRVVWIAKPTGDALHSAPPTAALSDLLPKGWSSVAMWLLFSIAVCIAVASRRFGSVVHEGLPVVADSLETVRGRAFIYQRFGLISAAATNLRAGAASRIAHGYRLPRNAPIRQVTLEIATQLRRPESEISAIFIGPVQTSQELVQLAQDLSTLEQECRRHA